MKRLLKFNSILWGLALGASAVLRFWPLVMHAWGAIYLNRTERRDADFRRCIAGVDNETGMNLEERP
jgi:hypothetical protein